MPVNGLVVMTPTSVDKTGTGSTATINANGSVSFSSCETWSLNNVFSTAYDNYMITMRFVGTADSRNLLARLRANQVDASGANYTRQVLYASSTSVAAARTTSTTYLYFTIGDSEMRSGLVGYIFGPRLAQPTAVRTVTSSGNGNAQTWDEALTHSLGTAYDGISFITDQAGTTYSGLVTVFGFNQ